MNDRLDDLQFRKREHDDTGVRRIFDEGHVRPGDQAGRPCLAPRDDLGTKLLLNLDRFFGRDVPRMEMMDLHGQTFTQSCFALLAEESFDSFYGLARLAAEALGRLTDRRGALLQELAGACDRLND